MTALTPSTATAETVAAPRLLLTQMGTSPTDLVIPDTRMPTFAEVIPQARTRLLEGTLRTYNTHFEHCSHTGPDGVEAILEEDIGPYTDALNSAESPRAGRPLGS
ncbi:hypothetical protein [Nocardia barduliensis]|uniref:hypothetical protein n=1 Tax=Nocardia barduliensis TaxID=2736643 RepID=UPI00157160BC|nr:hypothetical protein [Nocardia barduliensis]